jgi:glycosyltransferase involved in cell wall biosynthesis
MINEYTKWLPDNKVDYIYNGIDDKFKKLISINTNTEEKLLNKSMKYNRRNDIIVLYLSKLTHSKGIFVLFDAIKLIFDKGLNNIKFTIAGEFWDKFPEEKIKIDNLMKLKYIQEMVTLLGFIKGEKKINELLKSDIFVFPSLNDSFGSVNLEAMSASLPIIATPQGAIPEYIIDRLNGYIIPENDPIQLCDKIILLANNEELRLKIGRYNRKSFSSSFEKKIFEENWLNEFLNFYK